MISINKTIKGVDGVSFLDNDGSRKNKYWKAGYQKGEKSLTKWYNINKYRFKKAKELATEKRLQWEKQFDK